MAQETNFAVKLFSYSVLKQAKLSEVKSYLGETEDKVCLDLGSDNGVISYYLREGGGKWFSADMTDEVVLSIRSLVKENVDKVGEGPFPYENQSFDKVVVVDMLEHVKDESFFILELYRILKPGGELIINTPNLKPWSFLRMFRHLIGQTDEAHGHLRPGYSEADLKKLTAGLFDYEKGKTYSGFFSESVDTGIVFAYGLLKKLTSLGGKKEEKDDANKSDISKGLVVTSDGLKKFEKQFKLYKLIYPAVSLFSKLDKLIFFIPGYMRIAYLQKE